MKNEAGVWITPAFPKLIYVLEEDNIHPGDPYYYLTELAAKCTAKRMVPGYISEKRMLELKVDKNGGGHCYTCMGCRSFLTPYVDPETGKPKYESPVSYWMPFEGNMIGFHDATWQNDKSFDNAESYKWCGSHGCINLRLADAKALHDCIKVGLCVVVHS